MGLVYWLLYPPGMLRPLLALATLTTLTSAASAESDGAGVTDAVLTSKGYVIGAGSVGIQRAIQGGASVEGGKHLAGTHRFIRGQLAFGVSGRVGDYQQVRIGYEHRGCIVHDTLCAFGGIDAGYQHDRVERRLLEWGFGDGPSADYMVDAHDLILVPRAGVELGRHIKARLSLELPFYRRLDTHMDADSSDGGVGLSLSAGLGYAF